MIWTDCILNAFSMYFPLLFAALLHMLVVRFDLFPMLNLPVHERFFGKNKTIRGFVVFPVFTVLCLEISHLLSVSLYQKGNIVWLGVLLGLGYLLAELPNSYIKRRLKIPEGVLISGPLKILQIFFDRIDSALGCALVFYFYLDKITFIEIVFFILINIFIFPIFIYLLYRCGLRRNPL